MNALQKNIQRQLFPIFLFTISLFFTSNLVAKTIYIAPTGKTYSSYKSSSYDDPVGFNTILAATSSMPSSLVASGDTVYFIGSKGQYDVNKAFTFVQSAGTADGRTYLGSYPGETAIFDFRTQPYADNSRGLTIKVNYVHVYGIVVRYAGDNGMYISGKNNFIENCSFYGNCDSGLQVMAGDNVIKDCDSYQNFDYKTMSGSSPDYGGNADGFADTKKTDRTGTTNTYINCRSWENSDDGWDFYGVKGETVIANSWCMRNGPVSYDLTDFPRYETDKAFLDQFKDGNGKIIVKNYGNGNGFKVGGGTTTSDATTTGSTYKGEWAINNVTLSNCVSVENKVKGFDQNNNHGKMVLYNCTGYKNAPNYGFSNATGTTTSLIVKNCISASNKASDSFKPTSGDRSYNNWGGNPNNFTVSDADFRNVNSTDFYVNRNIDGTLPDMNGLFRLSSTSQCIDKGTDVGLSYNGNFPDLGAFEYQTSSGIKSQQTQQIKAFISNDNLYFDAQKIELYTINGYKILTAENVDSIPVSQLNKGVYFSCLYSSTGEITCKKIIKK